MKAIEEMAKAYKQRSENPVRFLYYVADHIGFVILSVEKSHADIMDYYRAKRYCSMQEYELVYDESEKLSNAHTLIESTFYAIKASRELTSKGELSAGKISFAVASGTKTTEDRESPSFGYIPSHPPLTVPEKRFREFVKEDPVFKRASVIMPFEIEFVEVYNTLISHILLYLAGWVRKEGIEKTFEQFKH